jgi:hypothetical protein
MQTGKAKEGMIDMQCYEVRVVPVRRFQRLMMRNAEA